MKEYLANNLLPNQQEERDSLMNETYDESQGDYVRWATRNNQDYEGLFGGKHAAEFEAGYEDPLDLHSDTE